MQSIVRPRKRNTRAGELRGLVYKYMKKTASFTGLNILRAAISILFASNILTTLPAGADEGGVSFWLPGQFGSFAAVPVSEGWSLGTVYYHTSADARGSREFPIGGRITAGLDTSADLLFIAPSYALASEVMGGQLALTVTGVVGQVDVDVEATLTDPGGNTVEGRQSDSNSGIGDLYPMAALRWNQEVA